MSDHLDKFLVAVFFNHVSIIWEWKQGLVTNKQNDGKRIQLAKLAHDNELVGFQGHLFQTFEPVKRDFTTCPTVQQPRS